MMRFDVAEGIARVTLDRPPVDALDETMVEPLDRFFTRREPAT